MGYDYQPLGGSTKFRSNLRGKGYKVLDVDSNSGDSDNNGTKTDKSDDEFLEAGMNS